MSQEGFRNPITSTPSELASKFVAFAILIGHGGLKRSEPLPVSRSCIDLHFVPAMEIQQLTPTPSQKRSKKVTVTKQISAPAPAFPDCSSSSSSASSQTEASKGPLSKSKSVEDRLDRIFEEDQLRAERSRMWEQVPVEESRKLFGISLSRQTTPQQKVKTLNSLVLSLPADPQDRNYEKNQKRISKYLIQLKAQLFGDKPLPEKEQKGLIETMIKCGFLTSVAMNLAYLEFEDRKSAAVIFGNLLRRNWDGMAVDYIRHNSKILFYLIHGYRTQSIALLCGRMLRECLHHEMLAKEVFRADYIYELFDLLKTPAFEISSAAFVTMESIMFEHKRLAADYLFKHFDRFFSQFDEILRCDNFVTQVSSLKLLGRILLDRRYYDVMKKYVANWMNLKEVILLMSASSTNLQFEAFHVFKVFTANPEMEPRVRTVLIKNKARLIDLLGSMDAKRHGENFEEERAYLIKLLKKMDKGAAPGQGTTDSSDDESSSRMGGEAGAALPVETVDSCSSE